MPNAHPIGLRERAVRAYQAGQGSYDVIGARFAIAPRTLQDWVARFRATGSVAPIPKGGGNPSPIDVKVLEGVLRERPDAVVDEIRTAYNDRVRRQARLHRSSILRALHRLGYVFKKNVQPPQSRIAPTSKRSEGRS
jgi:transposase